MHSEKRAGSKSSKRSILAARRMPSSARSSPKFGAAGWRAVLRIARIAVFGPLFLFLRPAAAAAPDASFCELIANAAVAGTGRARLPPSRLW